MTMPSKEEAVTAYRMYIEGVWDTLQAQKSEDYAGEIADLIDDILWDLYRDAYVQGMKDQVAALEKLGRLKEVADERGEGT